MSVNQLSLLSPLNDKQTQRQIPRRGKREACSKCRQGQKALKEMKLNPTAPLTGRTRMVILEQVWPLFLNWRLNTGLLPKSSKHTSCFSEKLRLNFFFLRGWYNFNVAQAVNGHNNQTAVLFRKQSYWTIDNWKYKGGCVSVLFYICL